MKRVLPRDAFNDANLLKCIGQLTLLIEEGRISLTYEYDGLPFNILQDPSDGSTYVENVRFYTSDGEFIHHKRALNSRDLWPLILVKDDEEYYVFDTTGVIQESVIISLPKDNTVKNR